MTNPTNESLSQDKTQETTPPSQTKQSGDYMSELLLDAISDDEDKATKDSPEGIPEDMNSLNVTKIKSLKNLKKVWGFLAPSTKIEYKDLTEIEDKIKAEKEKKLEDKIKTEKEIMYYVKTILDNIPYIKDITEDYTTGSNTTVANILKLINNELTKVHDKDISWNVCLANIEEIWKKFNLDNIEEFHNKKRVWEIINLCIPTRGYEKIYSNRENEILEDIITEREKAKKWEISWEKCLANIEKIYKDFEKEMKEENSLLVSTLKVMFQEWRSNITWRAPEETKDKKYTSIDNEFKKIENSETTLKAGLANIEKMFRSISTRINFIEYTAAGLEKELLEYEKRSLISTLTKTNKNSNTDLAFLQEESYKNSSLSEKVKWILQLFNKDQLPLDLVLNIIYLWNEEKEFIEEEFDEILWAYIEYTDSANTIYENLWTLRTLEDAIYSIEPKFGLFNAERLYEQLPTFILFMNNDLRIYIDTRSVTKKGDDVSLEIKYDFNPDSIKDETEVKSRLDKLTKDPIEFEFITIKEKTDKIIEEFYSIGRKEES